MTTVGLEPVRVQHGIAAADVTGAADGAATAAGRRVVSKSAVADGEDAAAVDGAAAAAAGPIRQREGGESEGRTEIDAEELGIPVAVEGNAPRRPTRVQGHT